MQLQNTFNGLSGGCMLFLILLVPCCKLQKMSAAIGWISCACAVKQLPNGRSPYMMVDHGPRLFWDKRGAKAACQHLTCNK